MSFVMFKFSMNSIQFDIEGIYIFSRLFKMHPIHLFDFFIQSLISPSKLFKAACLPFFSN
jgi:hypothetical protein